MCGHNTWCWLQSSLIMNFYLLTWLDGNSRFLVCDLQVHCTCADVFLVYLLCTYHYVFIHIIYSSNMNESQTNNILFAALLSITCMCPIIIILEKVNYLFCFTYFVLLSSTQNVIMTRTKKYWKFVFYINKVALFEHIPGNWDENVNVHPCQIAKCFHHQSLFAINTWSLTAEKPFLNLLSVLIFYNANI